MRIATFVTTAALTLLSTIAVAQNATYDYDKTADFSRFKTYAWAPGTNLNDEWNHQRIVNAIDAQLAAKGLIRVESGAKPDVLVAYHTAFDRALEVNGYASGWAGPRFGNRTGSARAEEVMVGTLVVDIRDAGTGAIVWRGMASRDVDTRAKPERREKNINRTAEKILKNYPPKP